MVPPLVAPMPLLLEDSPFKPASTAENAQETPGKREPALSEKKRATKSATNAIQKAYSAMAPRLLRRFDDIFFLLNIINPQAA